MESRLGRISHNPDVTESDLTRLGRRAPGMRPELLIQAVGNPNNESVLRRRSMGMAIESPVSQIKGEFTRPC